MAINPDFRDLLCEFNAREVRYLVVGGYAFSFHVRPRYTEDLDLWIDPDPANAQRAWEALAAFGAPLTELSPDDLAQPGTIFQIGQPPNRVDILTRIQAIPFEEAWAQRAEGTYGDQKTCSSRGRTSCGTSEPSAGRRILPTSKRSSSSSAAPAVDLEAADPERRRAVTDRT